MTTIRELVKEMSGLEGNIKSLIIEGMIELVGNKVNNYAYYLEANNYYIVYDAKDKSFAIIGRNKIETEGRGLSSLLEYMEEDFEYHRDKERTSNIKERIKILL